MSAAFSKPPFPPRRPRPGPPPPARDERPVESESDLNPNAPRSSPPRSCLPPPPERAASTSPASPPRTSRRSSPFSLSRSSPVSNENEGRWCGDKTRLSTCDPHARRSVFSSLVMLLVTMIFAVLGFLSPSNRGGTVGSYTPTLGLYRFVCWVFYKMFKGTEWKKIFFVLNALFWGESYVGFKKPAIEDPWKTNKIPRQIPEQA
ncbi:transmembrane 9 superfamily member [Musa troglodytarum]|uniref:Transmembrane 9 superfamily member n=1 Tax=Musa troglodytarum TaxID=320322 RepID=A0A9E7FDL2_9LILI|nr:transmembrane 9 superfamily member [Musa troglodytarum]